MDIAEFILKMFSVGFLIAGILGMMFQSINFQGQLRVYENWRLAIDFANAAAAAPCLAQTVGTDVRKGVIDFAKLDSARNNFCLAMDKPYKISIKKGSNEIFSIENLDSRGGIGLLQPIPILIKEGETYSGGTLYARVG